jgi:hypothetical protein
MMKSTILIYVEDPGACNYVRELPEKLATLGVGATLHCSGAAVQYLEARKTHFEYVEPSTSASNLLKEHLPELVVVGTSEEPDSFAFKLIDNCKNQKIPSVAVVDMEANADRRFRGHSTSPLNHMPDWLFVPDESCRSVYERLGVLPENVLVVGHPHFDHVRNMGFILKDKASTLKHKIIPTADRERFIITFIAEGYDRLNRAASLRGSDYTLHGRGQNNFRSAIVLEELIDAICELNPKPYLVLRLHPKMSQDDLVQYNQEVNYISRLEDPLELLTVSDLVVGMSSMLLQEAAIMGKPTLAILPRAVEKQWLPATASGYTPAVVTRTQLKETVRRLVNEPELFRQNADLFFLPNSLARVATTLKDILNDTQVKQAKHQ